MKTAFGIFKRDVGLLLRNPIALFVVLALLVLPGLYAWYCIIANWDPYENTGSLPIAVVNKDAGASSNLTGDVDIGEQVVGQLRENGNLDWRFYEDEAQALEDTRLGQCYATIVFPATLSKDVVGIFSGGQTYPAIKYYPNQKPNAVATKVTDSAALTLEREINQAFASQVNQKALAKVQESAAKMEDSAEQTQANVLDEVGQAEQDIETAIAMLDNAETSIDSWRQALARAQDSLAGLAAELPPIRENLDAASQDLEGLRQKTAEFDSSFSSALLQANQSLSGLSARASGRVARASADAQKLSGSIEGALERVRGFRAQVEELITVLPAGEARTKLESVLGDVDGTLGSLEDTSANVARAANDASGKAEGLNQTVQDATDATDVASRTFSTEILPLLSSGTSSLARSASTLSGSIGQLEPQIAQLQQVLEQADEALVMSSGSIDQAMVLLRRVEGNLDTTVTDLGAMQSALQADTLSKLLQVNPQNMGEFVSSPVRMVTEKIYPVSNYGSAVAPFYTNLALWIGCFILISVIRLEVDRRGFEQASANERFFGRWLLLVLLALVQSQIICGVDILLGIDCANPGWFMLAGAVASLAYMNVIFALAISFRNIGKTLCILLLIMQVPGSSGMYPIEMMPAFFQALNPFLPFTYSINAMREALCGMYGATFFHDLALLATLVPAALVLGVLIRPRLLNLVQLFDEEMSKTGFFDREEHGQGGDDERIADVVHALAESDSHRERIEEQARRFNSWYPVARRVGSLVVFAMPFALLAIMLPVNLLVELDTNAKLLALAIMILLLFLVMTALVVLEYVHRTFSREMRLLGIEPEGYGTIIDDVDEKRQNLQRRVDGKRQEVLEQLSERVGSGERDTRLRLGAPREIFYTDLRLGLQSVVGVVVVMLLVITPSLYAWFNIAGSWDPYSRTDGLRVAVANEDEGFKGDLIPVRLSVGDTVVSQLHDNTNFDWQFVSAEEAVAGIEEGRYYASIVIPADFSKNMLTYLTEDADYPSVRYYTNEKENPIAPLIMQKGADSIQEIICETFNERVDEVTLGLASEALGYLDKPQVADFTTRMGVRLDDAMFDMQEASSQMRSLADLAGMVAGVVGTADAAIQGLASSAETAQQAIDQAEQGVVSAEQAFDQVDGLLEMAVSQSTSGLDVVVADADSALAALQSQVSDAPERIGQVSNQVSAWETAVAGVYDAIQAQAGNPSNPPEVQAAFAAAGARIKPLLDALVRLQNALVDVSNNSVATSTDIEGLRGELSGLLAQAKTTSDQAQFYYRDSLKPDVDNLEATMASVFASSRSVTDNLEASMADVSQDTGSLTSQLTQVKESLGGTADSLDGVARLIEGARGRVDNAAQSKDSDEMVALLVGSDTTQLATRLTAPVEERKEAIFPVANYGSNMAPFYTVLSLWVGALVMISTMKTHLLPERAEELRRRYRLKPRHEYLGRLGIFSGIALLQALIVSLGDLCLLHIQCVHPVLFVLECVVIGQVFTLIVYTLSELFGDVGRALCVILLIMQVAASGGTFPVEMLGVFREVAVCLPFHQGMSALQGCVAGIYAMDTFLYMSALLVFVPVMLFMGVGIRTPLRRATDWLEAQLEKTNFM